LKEKLLRIGLSYDLKEAVEQNLTVEDALEEYDSPETVAIIATALASMGHEVIRLGGGAYFLDNIRREKVDIVFNIAEGRGNYRSREAQVPAVLEMLSVPYTGSDPLTLAVCLDKPLTKKLVVAEGINTPHWLVISGQEELDKAAWEKLAFPVIIKPASEGSSKGIRLTSVTDDIRQAETEVRRILDAYHQPVMVEEFIDGDEVTVGIVGNSPPRIVGMMRVVPRKPSAHFVYSLEVKRDYLNLVDYECPPQLGKNTLDVMERFSVAAFKTLGCRDFSRIDFRVGRDGTPYFIEINPLPGLGSYSDLVIMAQMLGWKYEALIGSVLDAAIERYSRCVRV
jgi:D-alanine-D-alanine ligase